MCSFAKHFELRAGALGPLVYTARRPGGLGTAAAAAGVPLATRPSSANLDSVCFQCARHSACIGFPSPPDSPVRQIPPLLPFPDEAGRLREVEEPLRSHTAQPTRARDRTYPGLSGPSPPVAHPPWARAQSWKLVVFVGTCDRSASRSSVSLTSPLSLASPRS